MYEERFVDVASYVCRILDQIPASPISPMYVDWGSLAGEGRGEEGGGGGHPTCSGWDTKLCDATLDILALRVM